MMAQVLSLAVWKNGGQKTRLGIEEKGKLRRGRDNEL